MIELARERAGPYIRALSTALSTCAPNHDFVPLAEASAHLAALDPALSGPQLLPAQVEPRSGMPSYPWMERVIAERSLARDANPPTEDEVARAIRLDPDLGDRLASRRRLQQHLLWHPVLPCLLYTSPSPRDATLSRMPSSA